jgi:hypothetical protein
MNKKFIYYFLTVVVVGSLPIGTSLLRKHYVAAKKDTPIACTLEAKICPDGSSVSRQGEHCEFAVCPTKNSDATSSLETTIATTTNQATTSEVQKISKSTKIPPQTQPVIKKISIASSVISSIKSTFSSTIDTVTSPFKKEESSTIINYYPSSVIPASTYIQSSSTEELVYKPLPPENFAGEKYLVKDGIIISNDNKIIYSIPQEVVQAVSSPNTGWTNTTINVVPIGSVPPLVNAIPITDLPGKYYLSENSFGDLASCQFSNKIFILDTYTNIVTLMYEENNTTLSRDDPRACNSEIFLLATENSKLILKYHTIGTNSLCDSAWSEPEKTFYLDVTKLQSQGMQKYDIPENLTAGAEQEEEACRVKL